MKGKTKDGAEFSTDGVLTFAVGDDADVQAAQDTTWNPDDAQTAGSSIPTWVFVLAGVGAVVLLLALGLALRSAKRGDNRG